MNNKLFIALVVVAAGILAGWYFLKGSPGSMTNNGVTITPTQAASNLGLPEDPGLTPESMEKGGESERTVVTFSVNGFAPSSVSVKAGTIVTFVNESDKGMWVASDPHPAHTILPEFDAKKGVSKGESYEFTFTEVGTWGYHNHMQPGMKGTVIVTP